MKFAIGILPESMRSTMEKAALAEAHGYDLISTGDMQSTHRELHMTLSAMATGTAKIRLGSGMTNPRSRDLAVTAGAFATLAEYSDNRVFIGIANGDSALHNIGLKPTTLRELEDAVVALRRLFTDGKAMFDGRELRLTWWKGGPIPIYMSAHGPKSLELAGRIADGVIVGHGLTDLAVEFSLERIAAGARASGRSLDQLDIWFLTHVGLADDAVSARAAIGNTLAVSANLLARGPLDTVPDRYRAAFAEFVARYSYESHAKVEGGHNSALIEELGLAEYLAERFAVSGPAAFCRERIADLRKAGVENFWCSRAASDWQTFIPAWSQAVIAPR